MVRVAGFELGRVLLTALMVWYGLLNAFDPARGMFLDNVNLIIHEAGHALWRPFGEFLYFLGGSLTQVIVPLAFLVYFWRSNQRFAACVAAFWTATSLFHLSVYVGDARAMELPLLGGEYVTHDWNWILSELNLLPLDWFLSRLVYLTGLLYLILGLAGAAYWSRGDTQGLPWRQAASGSGRKIRISRMKNLGLASEKLLAGIGIHDAEALTDIGAIEAFRRLRLAGQEPNLSLLYTLHGAITDQAWDRLPVDQKEHLKLEVAKIEAGISCGQVP
jgi:TfoX C-terminal domain